MRDWFITSTSLTSATFEASVAKWNMDSPAKNPPIRTPYKPPINSPESFHVSIEWAQPSRCSSRYASTTSRDIHEPLRGNRAQCSMTSSNCSLILQRIRIALRRNERDTISESSSMIARGLGDHQPMALSRPTGMGNKPRRYPAMIVSGSRSAPTAIRSSSGNESGNAQRQSPTGVGLWSQLPTRLIREEAVLGLAAQLAFGDEFLQGVGGSKVGVTE